MVLSAFILLLAVLFHVFFVLFCFSLVQQGVLMF